jgi:hypothetical protein
MREGPAPQAESKISQLTASRGGDNSIMEQEEGSGVTMRTHRAQSEDYLMFLIYSTLQMSFGRACKYYQCN